jgi:hypothetical protein
MSKYIDFSNNEELWKEAKHMSGLGISVLEEGRSEGQTEGRTKESVDTIIAFLQDCGEVSDSLKQEISSQKDINVLRKWVKLAAKAGSIEEFEEAIGLARL